MKPGIPVEQRDVLLIPFPFSDLSSSKKRPALVLSDSEYNGSNEDVLCCMITSNPDKHDYDVYIDSCDMESGKLAMPSKVKPYRIFSVHKSIIVKTIGRLDRSKSKEVIKNIELIISLK
jgi:mRNA interferase MazF